MREHTGGFSTPSQLHTKMGFSGVFFFFVVDFFFFWSNLRLLLIYNMLFKTTFPSPLQHQKQRAKKGRGAIVDLFKSYPISYSDWRQ